MPIVFRCQLHLVADGGQGHDDLGHALGDVGARDLLAGEHGGLLPALGRLLVTRKLVNEANLKNDPSLVPTLDQYEHRCHLKVAAVALLPARLHGELLADVFPRILPRAVVLERPGPVRHLDELLDDVGDRVLGVPAHTEDVFTRAGSRGWWVVAGGGHHGGEVTSCTASTSVCARRCGDRYLALQSPTAPWPPSPAPPPATGCLPASPNTGTQGLLRPGP